VAGKQKYFSARGHELPGADLLNTTASRKSVRASQIGRGKRAAIPASQNRPGKRGFRDVSAPMASFATKAETPASAHRILILPRVPVSFPLLFLALFRGSQLIREIC